MVSGNMHTLCRINRLHVCIWEYVFKYVYMFVYAYNHSEKRFHELEKDQERINIRVWKQEGKAGIM